MNSVKKFGFTLIELLVVISIIGLLSSVVLASLNGARKKADDSQRNSIVGEYVKALALAYDAGGTGQYPGTADGLVYCLGDYLTIGTYGQPSACRQGFSTALRSENADVQNMLAGANKFLPSLPTLKPTVLSSTYTYDGPFYQCSLTNCATPTIEWYLEQPNQKCIKGAAPTTPSAGTGTRCSLQLN